MSTSVIRGLSSIQNVYAEDERRKEAAAAGKSKWFRLNDKESANVVFLQELDETAKGYDPERGLGFLAVEHTNPEDFRKKALCTADEGACFGCEMNRAGWESNNGKSEDDKTRYTGRWKAKRKLYINVLVTKAGEEPYVAILSQGDSAKMIVKPLLEIAIEDGTITDQVFKITRSGEGFETSYSLLPRPKETMPDTSGLELADLDAAVRKVEYEDQPAHFGVAVKAEEPVAASVADDDSW